MNPLCHGKMNTGWELRPWPWFKAFQNDPKRIAILPLYGMGNGGTGYPLDYEEQIGSKVLSEAVNSWNKGLGGLITLPPVRYLPPAGSHSRFGISLEAAHRQLEDILVGVKGAGFKKVVLYSTSSAMRSFADVAARDNRIALALQVFCINLLSLGVCLGRDLSAEQLERGGNLLVQGLEEIMQKPLERDMV